MARKIYFLSIFFFLIFSSGFYANKMYIKTPLKFMELQKDEIDFYVFAGKAEVVFPEPDVTVGLSIFGFVGGIVGAIIDVSEHRKEVESTPKTNIYLGQLTGEYIFGK